MEGKGGCSGVEHGCRTPKHRGSQILAALECPLAPRKTPAYSKQQSTPPKQGYFQPPDLEVLFAIASRREAYAD
ncbi:hypothetical protein RHMOL_Rhmol01G0134300 [Rhododendron molle]|uniref:Uncharacterized protein n=1 Tax=Rhododendron molle TaxID=49168 RepID=A0ACC0Q2Y7_RHOML|nr:hypothetical protein RHMOL_Rhmol01G0134300 [Rhododendron molle]